MRRWWSIVLAPAVLLASTLTPTSALAAGRALYGQVTGVAGQPLAHADVELFEFGAGRVAEAETDSAGGFHFAIPDESAAYWVRVWAPNYKEAETAWFAGAGTLVVIHPEPLTATVSVRGVDPKTGATVSGVSYDLLHDGQGRSASGAPVQGLSRLQVPADGGYLLRAWAPGRQPLLLPIGALAGGTTAPLTVELAAATGKVAGQVVSALDGRPLPLAMVDVLRDGYGVVARGQVDKDGSFHYELPAGAAYQVQVTAPGFKVARTASFTLGSGAVQDFGGEQRLALSAATGDLAGRLIGTNGDALVGVTVSLERKPLGVVAQATTDTDGRFHFDGLPVGDGLQYRVRAESVNGTWQGTASPWQALEGGKITQIALRVSANGFTGWGHGNVLGMVVTPDGTPLAGAEVELWSWASGRVAKATTSSDGRFVFRDVAGNRIASPYVPSSPAYYLKVSASGMFTSTLAGDSQIDVTGDRDTVVTATLQPTQAPANGRVIDGDGTPLAGALVTLTAEADGKGIAVKTDPDGRWHVDALAVGATYHLHARLDGYLDGVAADLQPDPSGSSSRDLTLRAATATLSGQVSDSYGQPVVGAHVVAWSPAGEYKTETAADGGYTLAVPAGQNYLLTASSAGAASGWGEDGAIKVQAPAPGERLENEITLWSNTGTVSGMLLTPAGAPASGIAVELVQEGKGVVATVITDAGGAYRFDKVAAGARYAVRPAKGAYCDATSQSLPPVVLLAPGSMQSVNLTWLGE